MKTTMKYLMLALVAVLACVSISSCTDDYDESNYYLKLYDVGTNLTDANGVLLNKAIKDEWDKANKADDYGRVIIGKMDEKTAINFFNQFIDNMEQGFDEAYRGKIIQGGIIRYYFSIGTDHGPAVEYATIEVTNSGAYRIE